MVNIFIIYDERNLLISCPIQRLSLFATDSVTKLTTTGSHATIVDHLNVHFVKFFLIHRIVIL